MPKLLKHVPVRRGLDTVWLRPGDELPGWAVGLVGDHALAPDDVNVDDVDTAGDADEAKPAATPKATAPDFTGSAPRRRQSRK